MFGQRSTTTPPAQPQQPTTTTPSPSSSLLQAISDRDSRYRPTARLGLQHASAAGALQVGNGPIHPSTNPASFRSLLGSHRVVADMFTSATYPPRRMIEPVFEELVRSKG
jgi:hypothetical protein